MLVSIGLEQIELDVIIGALEKERAQKQKLWIDLELSYNAAEAIEKDSVEKVVDYRDLENDCIEIAKKKFFLLETFANHLIERLFSSYPLLSAKVKVSKKAYGIKADKSFVTIEKQAMLHERLFKESSSYSG